MNRIIIAGIIVITIIGIIYFTGFEESKIQNAQFLDIVNYEIIQNENAPLFLSVIVSGNIPNTIDTNNLGYGFEWFDKNSEKLYGYTTNIHSESEWHTESIVIDDVQQFCFDDVELVISNVMINQNNIKVIVEINDTTNFDRIISYEIIKDDNCHLGFAGKIIDEYKID